MSGIMPLVENTKTVSGNLDSKERTLKYLAQTE